MSNPVLCVETEEVFSCINDAYKKHGGAIAKVCNGKQEKAFELSWRYLTEKEKLIYSDKLNKIKTIKNNNKKFRKSKEAMILEKNIKKISKNFNPLELQLFKLIYSLKSCGKEFLFQEIKEPKNNIIYCLESLQRKKIISLKDNGLVSLLIEFDKIERRTLKRPIICITTGEEFSSIKDAANWFNIKSCNICDVCSGKSKAIKGLVFKYKENKV